MAMRRRLERRLAWMREANFGGLTTPQLATISKYVETLMAQDGRVRCPAWGKVVKERRLGRTNRLGWRWVVYVAETDAPQDWQEVSVCTTRRAAWDAKGRHIGLRVLEVAERWLAEQERYADGEGS